MDTWICRMHAELVKSTRYKVQTGEWDCHKVCIVTQASFTCLAQQDREEQHQHSFGA